MNAARCLVSRMMGLRDLSMSPMTGMRQLSVSRPVKTIYNVRTEAEYEDRVVRSIKPTLVMWHEPGCQDCEKLSGKFETAVDLVDGLDLVKVDVTHLKELAMSRGVMDGRDVPTTNAVVKGEELGGAMIGLLDDEIVKNLVNAMLKLDSNSSVNMKRLKNVLEVKKAKYHLSYSIWSSQKIKNDYRNSVIIISPV